MGTRNLTAVYVNGQYKVAKYCQWDGYPDVQGVTALAFARRISDRETRSLFASRVMDIQNATKSYLNNIANEKNWPKKHSELSRDIGAEILSMIMDGPSMTLFNEIEFASDSLSCEWAWVIDLDKGTFEGFRGFNKTPLTPNDRFYFLRNHEEDNGFHGVRLAAEWSLDNLPSDSEFLAAFDEDDEEQDADDDARLVW